MATAKLGFNTFSENQVVDWALINENYEKLDGMCLCKEGLTQSTSVTGANAENARWRIKKYADSTIEACTKIDFSSVNCNTQSGNVFTSPEITVNLPIALSEVDFVGMHMASQTVGWVMNTTPNTTNTQLKFKMVSMASESNTPAKRVYICVKGKV